MGSIGDKERRWLYSPKPGKPEIVDVPAMNYISVDGVGSPESEDFQKAMQALYSLAYTIKFMVKKLDPGRDFKAGPLEGLWWMDDMREFSLDTKESWKWTVMIPLPDHVTLDEVLAAKQEVLRKKGVDLRDVRFGPFHEGLCAQVMHIGPYAAEAPTVKLLHEFIGDNGYEMVGKHHEIYLGDPRTTAPEKLKTILRQPISRR